MKTKILLVSIFISAGLVASASAAGRGNGNAGRGSGNRAGICDLSGPGQGTPLRDGSGKLRNNQGNPKSVGTPLRDGSGKTTATGKGPKNGTGNNANCPNLPPKT